ncbi:MAG: hypothetical protein AAB483_03185 [Patescibacteria group bacterium]
MRGDRPPQDRDPQSEIYSEIIGLALSHFEDVKKPGWKAKNRRVRLEGGDRADWLVIFYFGSQDLRHRMFAFEFPVAIQAIEGIGANIERVQEVLLYQYSDGKIEMRETEKRTRMDWSGESPSLVRIPSPPEVPLPSLMAEELISKLRSYHKSKDQ